MVRRFSIHRRQRSVCAQTLVEYSLLIALISLTAMSALEELGLHVKKAAASASCALVWAQYNVSSGNTNTIFQAYQEVHRTIDASFGDSSAELIIKNRLYYEQSVIAHKFGYPNTPPGH